MSVDSQSLSVNPSEAEFREMVLAAAGSAWRHGRTRGDGGGVGDRWSGGSGRQFAPGHAC